MVYVIVSNGNVTRQEFPPLPPQVSRAMDGSLVILKIKEGIIQKLTFGHQSSCYITVPKLAPKQDGLYKIKTDIAQPWDYRRVCVWEGDHWRTVGGRIEGDNRIPDGHIIDWEGPLDVIRPATVGPESES